MSLLSDREELLLFLRNNPMVTFDDLRKESPKLRESLHFFYGNRINSAKQDAGLRMGLKVDWLIRKKQLVQFLKRNPLCTANDVRIAGLGTTLLFLYGNRLNEAKADAGVVTSTIRVTRKQKRLQPKIKKLLLFMKKNPDAGTKEIKQIGLGNVSRIAFKSLEDAKRAVGIIPSNWIRCSEVAKRRKVSRQCIDILIRKEKLSSIKIGASRFVNLREVERYEKELRRKQNTSSFSSEE